MSKVRFHLDEHITHTIATELRQRGVDVTVTTEAGLRTYSDDAQMAFIQQEKRVLVTCDHGFLTRHAEGETHYGIVYYPTGKRSIGEVVAFLFLMHEVVSAEEMTGHVEYL